jgi:hypothetical protein
LAKRLKEEAELNTAVSRLMSVNRGEIGGSYCEGGTLSFYDFRAQLSQKGLGSKSVSRSNSKAIGIMSRGVV